MADEIIETGVDKLVNLIEKTKSIALDEAAKTLGVSTTVLEEWADFLEEEGMISIEYKLTNTYLVERKLSKKDIEVKAKEFTGKKEGFIRKVEGAIQAIENETIDLEKMKKEFRELQDMVSSEMGEIKGKLMQLEKYESLKKDIDRQIAGQHSDFQQKLADLDKEIASTQNRYQGIINDIQVEKGRLTEEKTRAESLREQDQKLRERIDLIEGIIDKLKSEINDEDKDVKASESHIEKLQRLAADTSEEVEKRREKLKALVEESKKHEDRIIHAQDEFIEDIRKRESSLKEEMVNTEEVTRRFEEFFKKKSEIGVLLDKINMDRDGLKRDLSSISKSALAFELTAKAVGNKSQIAELEEKFNELDRKKAMFKKGIDRLKELMTS